MSDGDGPRKGDTARWTCVIQGEVDEVYETSIHVMDEDGRRRVLSTVDPRVSVEVLERADDPSRALRGEVREINGMSAVCYGRDYWVYFSDMPGSVAGYGIYRDEQMVGAPVIGAVPGTPAAEAQTPVAEWEPGPRPAVRVANGRDEKRAPLLFRADTEPPPWVAVVEDKHGDRLRRDGDGWIGYGGEGYPLIVKPWDDHVLPKYAPYTEVRS